MEMAVPGQVEHPEMIVALDVSTAAKVARYPLIWRGRVKAGGTRRLSYFMTFLE
jgi:hypothetical protein